MNPFILIKRLIFVPKCAACETRLSPFPDKSVATYNNVCLCNDCYKKWRETTGELCDQCANPAHICTCTPKLLQKNFISFPSLFFYDSEARNTQNKVIYTLKEKRNRELVNFLASELYPHVKSELDIRKASFNSVIFTWIPRSKKSITKYGFDQGEELAYAIAKQFKTKALPILLRLGGKEQKKLGVDERRENLESSVTLNRNLLGFPLRETRDDISLILENKTVVIIDDIVTTGASMRRAIDLISSVSDCEIIVASIAKTRKQNK